MTLNFLIVLWIENTSFWSFIINLRLFYYDLLVASSFYCSLLWFWCECEPRSAGWSVFSCCSCLLFYRLTHGSCDGPHLRVAPSCPENYLKHHEACICLTFYSIGIGSCPLYCAELCCGVWRLCSCIPCVMFTATKSVESFPPFDYDKNIVNFCNFQNV